MFLLIYEISGKKDVHGLRMRLVYALRKQNAVQLMRSTWLISSFKPDLQEILNECIEQGYPVLLTEWTPLNLAKQVRKKEASPLIGIVCHSPEVTELGITKEFLSKLEDDGIPYQAILGGVMGRLAILDAQLEEKVFINHPYKPSEAIDFLIKRNVDLIVLLNQGISVASGIAFGRQVKQNSKLLEDLSVPLIQLDRLHDEDAFMIHWTQDPSTFQEWLQKNYHLTPLTPPIDQQVLTRTGEELTRILRAVQIGDKILVNGVIIGEVSSDQVAITTKSNEIINIQGGTINKHGVEKLGTIDLTTARLTTLKTLQRVNISPTRKIKQSKKKTNLALLTWRAELVYFNAEKVDCVVSIGDDTTFVSTEILSRFSCPIIGIIDGDADGILYEKTSIPQLKEFAPPKSLFLQVKPEHDDVVGHLIKKKIFKNKVKVKYSNLDALKKKIVRIANDFLVANG